MLLSAAAEKAGVVLGFEASVGGGIPILRVLREAVANDVNTEVFGLEAPLNVVFITIPAEGVEGRFGVGGVEVTPEPCAKDSVGSR